MTILRFVCLRIFVVLITLDASVSERRNDSAEKVAHRRTRGFETRRARHNLRGGYQVAD